ncbi:hypothetical protein ACGTRS_26020 [Burkholderia semiarida]|uniref:Uncharacterized protein n=1 Tax=Burkholderia semiarida TaxID=2843303 RepID=A0ABW7L9U0_9BURK
MTSEHDRLSYALANQVPAMGRGFRISTSYGDIEIGADDADKVAAVVRMVLERQLRSLTRAQVQQGGE